MEIGLFDCECSNQESIEQCNNDLHLDEKCRAGVTDFKSSGTTAHNTGLLMTSAARGDLTLALRATLS